MLLSSRLGLALYTLLPHRVGWALLTRIERARLREGNRYHDTTRADYADPACYASGGFDTSALASRWHQRDDVRDFLERYSPCSVLEVGPGAGFITRAIVEHPSVTRYVAVDFAPFIAYLEPRVTAFRPALFTTYVKGDLSESITVAVDAIIAVSVVHHIPDRPALFREMAARLKSGGRILCIEPAHGLDRLRSLLRKMTWARLGEQLALVRSGKYGTHAMLTASEMRACARSAGLTVTRVEYRDTPRRLPWWWAAQEVLVEMTYAGIASMASLQVPSKDELRFRAYRDKWRQERPSSTSSVAKMVMCPSYQNIIGMGPVAIGPILNELANQSDPEHWFWALAAISGKNPVPAESRGKTREMAKAWLRWGLSHGYWP